MKQLQTFTLLLKRYIFWAIKRLGYGPKIRVGRVIGNEHLFFLGLRVNIFRKEQNWFCGFKIQEQRANKSWCMLHIRYARSTLD